MPQCFQYKTNTAVGGEGKSVLCHRGADQVATEPLEPGSVLRAHGRIGMEDKAV